MKERADEGWTRLDGGQVRVYATAERFIAPQRGLADALTLEVIPDELVGVQLGRVARQEMQFEATGEPHDRSRRRGGLRRLGRRRTEGHDHFWLGVEQLAHQDRKALHPAASGPGVDHEVGPLGVAKGVQTFAERGLDWSLCGSVKKSDPVPLPCRRLRPSDE